MAENESKNGEIVSAESGEENRASNDLVVKTIPYFPKTFVCEGTGHHINLPKVECHGLLTVDVVNQKTTKSSPLFSAAKDVRAHPIVNHDARHGEIRNGGHNAPLLITEYAPGIVVKIIFMAKYACHFDWDVKVKCETVARSWPGKR